MSFKDFFKRFLSILGITCFLFFPYAAGQVWAADDIPWQEIQTKHSIIRYQSLEDLKVFNKKVSYSTGLSGLAWLYSGPNPDSLTDKLKKKADAIYERVQEILDMRKRMKKVNINIYHDKKQLHAAFYKIYKKNSRHRAWYIYEYNTIYICIEDIHEGMLAHEMAHSIIDHYLTVRPPPASAEILARYVDSHLLR